MLLTYSDLLDSVWGDFAAESKPRVDAWKSENGIALEVEVAGYSKGDIDLAIKDNYLTISGKKELDDKKEFLLRERSKNYFTRSLKLPFLVKEKDVKASIDNGVLRIEIKRPEVDSKKRIMIE